MIERVREQPSAVTEWTISSVPNASGLICRGDSDCMTEVIESYCTGIDEWSVSLPTQRS